METNNDSPNPIREDDWNEAAEENYPQELTEVLQAADVAEQLEQAQEEDVPTARRDGRIDFGSLQFGRDYEIK